MGARLFDHGRPQPPAADPLLGRSERPLLNRYSSDTPATRTWATEQRIAIQFAQRLCGALPATGKPTQTTPGISVRAITKLGHLMAENAHADDPARDLAQLTVWYLDLAWSLAEHDLAFFNACVADALCRFNERRENDEHHAKDRLTYY
ncbi:MAG TPA: hypothetical protein VF909_07820 [Roseiflexaceae bacterium]